MDVKLLVRYGIIGLLIAALIVGSIIYLANYRENINWNEGLCPTCSHKMRYEAVIYGPAYIYYCPNCGHQINIKTYHPESRIDIKNINTDTMDYEIM